MRGNSSKWGSGIRARPLAVLTLAGLTGACAMAGFGGALQLNITDQQTRQLTIQVSSGTADSRILELAGSDEVELGTGAARIERYVLQRATFGDDLATGYFLCAKPCAQPLSTYLLAYSPDQLFAPDGQLELRFRVVHGDGTTEEMSRSITAEALPSLWGDPNINAGPPGGD